MDGDSDGTPGSDMHTKKWSEYSSHGKITSSDPIDSSRTTTSSSGGDGGGFEPYRKEPKNDSNWGVRVNAEVYSPRKELVKKIVIGFCIHSVIFYVGFHASFYEELCIVPPGIIMPFYSCATGDIFHFDSIFGSFYLTLPLLIYFALFGKKVVAVVVPIVTVAMLIGFLVAYQQIDLGWSWWGWSELPLARHLQH